MSFVLIFLSIFSIVFGKANIMFLYTLCLFILFADPALTYYEPKLDDNETMSCEEFAQFARFNPYSVLNDEWMSFYYWGPTQHILFLRFIVPTTKQLAYLKNAIDGHVVQPVNWTAPLVMMIERETNVTYLLVEQGDRGQYNLYKPYSNLKPGDFVDTSEIRLKQVENGRYIGFMFCESEKIYALSRIKDVPKQIKIQDEAAKIGYRGRKGKSYLYRGHEWMPIPEIDENHYWDYQDMQHPYEGD